MKVKIRALEENDIGHLEPILMEHVKDRGTRKIIWDEIKSIKEYMLGGVDKYGRKRKYFIAETDPDIVLGCMAYSEPDPDMIKHFNTTLEESIEILNAFVNSIFFRGKGIGRQLFERVCQEAKKEGKKYLLVHSGPRYKLSWGFYKKMCDEECGFLIEKYGKGGDAKTWSKKL